MYQQSISGNTEFADGTDKRRLIYSNYYLRLSAYSASSAFGNIFCLDTYLQIRHPAQRANSPRKRFSTNLCRRSFNASIRT